MCGSSVARCGQEHRLISGDTSAMNADSVFLDRLSGQLKVDKSAACCRAIERILALVKRNYQDGKYGNEAEAELDVRRLVEKQGTCAKPKPATSKPA
jgi:hypothetical protein